MFSQYTADEKFIKALHRDMTRKVSDPRRAQVRVSFTHDPEVTRALCRFIPVAKAHGMMKRLEKRAQALGIHQLYLLVF